MNDAKNTIGWCSHTWNPVTGCLHGCPYCYARKFAERFGSHGVLDEYTVRFGRHGVLDEYTVKNVIESTAYELDRPALTRRNNGITAAPFPWDFLPTFHKYRLTEPVNAPDARDIFVGSMADLFGVWVPLRWIRDVLDACAAAPQHRYLFLTKNPNRYAELEEIALLPHNDRFWFGTTVTRGEVRFGGEEDRIHTFLSLEPLLGPVDLSRGNVKWVIIGAETGNRRGKVIPERAWVETITNYCAKYGIPVFYKSSLRALFPDLPPSAFPWED